MTTIDSATEAMAAPVDDDARDGGAVSQMLAADVDWLTTADHKKIGRLFLGAGVLAGIATTVISALLWLHRADVLSLDEGAIPQLGDAQRVGFVFGTLMPLSVGLCIAIVPLQLGARALAFPRLAAAGFWMWFGGLVLNVIALIGNGGGLGSDADMVDLFLASLGLMAIGIAAVGSCLVVSVLTTRAPGMTMRRVPFFAMSALITGLGIVLVMPVFVGTIAYLFVDHRNGREAFGGNTAIYEWGLWIFTQPTTYLFAIPALGLLAEGGTLLFKQRAPARGVMYAGLALVGVGAFGGVTQQSLFNVADLASFNEDLAADIVPSALFNLVPMLGVAIVMLMTLTLARPAKGVRPNVTPALAFGFAGVGMVLIGMLGNLLLVFDELSLQGSIFESGVVTSVVYGVLIAALGGFIHWSTKLWGVEVSTVKAMPVALLGVIATLLAVVPSYIEGFDDVRNIYSTLIAVGHVLMALTLLAFVGLLTTTVRNHDGSEVDDPYDGETLEWATTSPAPANNFVEPPTVMSAEPLADSKPGYGKKGDT